MNPQDILKDIETKANLEISNGAESCYLNYYLSKDDLEGFRKYCEIERINNPNFINKSWQERFGGIHMIETNDKNLFNTIKNALQTL